MLRETPHYPSKKGAQQCAPFFEGAFVDAAPEIRMGHDLIPPTGFCGIRSGAPSPRLHYTECMFKIASISEIFWKISLRHLGQSRSRVFSVGIPRSNDQ
jgi:hypothetical protein